MYYGDKKEHHIRKTRWHIIKHTCSLRSAGNSIRNNGAIRVTALCYIEERLSERGKFSFLYSGVNAALVNTYKHIIIVQSQQIRWWFMHRVLQNCLSAMFLKPGAKHTFTTSATIFWIFGVLNQIVLFQVRGN